MSKLANSFKLLYMLSDGRRHKAKELAEKIELKESSIRCYINDLRQAGFQVESLPGIQGGYWLDKTNCTNTIWKLIEKAFLDNEKI